ncbi:Acidic fibroblast growth factor intracellular binding protein [Fasciola hepatica]|uniref:Acidic fibroblast growth factor intracellular binding protein n=1 Tax=Fasciola hepatica TaxID=6192 RepID=A0A4E0R801_FASHE|nr:Acidic fibroblast growth factor intracellular binding protein [Fasciola hepatica]
MRSTKLIFLTWTVVFLMFKVHALKQAFCADFPPSVLALESTETWLPFFGTEINTLEQLMAVIHSSSAKELISNECLKTCHLSDRCRQDLRRLWIDLLLIAARDSHEYSQQMKELRSQYVFYRNSKQTPPSNKISQMFHTSCIGGCYLLLNKLKNVTLFRCACTDPCLVQKSCTLANCTTMGIFEHQYKCNCGSNEVWDEEVYSCISEDLHSLRTSSPEVTNCVCKPQYTGDNCSKLADACKERIQHPYLPNGGQLTAGNTACNVNHEGNSCQSFITAEGDPYYRCRCNRHTWIPNPDLRYDNCLKRRSMCDSVICVFGKCVTTTTGTKPICICLPGYSGKACTEWVGEWTEWSPWDLCRPACGDVRMTVRSRDCLSMIADATDKRDCRGPAIEYARCAEHPCARSEGTYLSSYFAIRQNAIAASVSTAAIACATVSTIWLMFCWSNLSSTVRVLFLAWKTRYRS